MFQGLSGALVLPIIAWLIVTQGWRMACVVGGAVMLFVGLPLVWFFVKQHRPEYYGLLPDGATVKEEVTDADQMIDRGVEYAAEVEDGELTLRQVMRTPTHWLLLVAEAFHGLMAPTMNLHSIPLLTDRGIDPLVAAGIAAFLLNQQSMAMIYVWFILYGVGHGAAISIMMPLRARYFGRKAYGSISGISSMFNTPIGMAIPVYAGWVYDTTGSYISVFTLLVGALALAAVVMCFIPPPKPPAHITDIHKIV